MPIKAKLKIEELELDIIFYDTECAKKIVEALPIRASFNVWGDEFYFEIPIQCEPDETATINVDVGDIGYWPAGSALALFFGPTPISTTNKPVPASEVNIVGKILTEPTLLKNYKNSNELLIERAL